MGYLLNPREVGKHQPVGPLGVGPSLGQCNEAGVSFLHRNRTGRGDAHVPGKNCTREGGRDTVFLHHPGTAPGTFLALSRGLSTKICSFAFLKGWGRGSER